VDRIRVEDFASYERADVSLRDLGKTVSIYGSTGAGKTTLFIDAITCALYGRAYGERTESSRKWVIPRGKESAKVLVDFTWSDRRYRIRRLIRPYRDEARLYTLEKDTEVPLADGSRAVEQKVEEIIGFDYTTFLNTIVVRQGEVALLLDAKPQERRNVFLGAFAIDFTKYQKKADEKREKSQLNITKLVEGERLLLENLAGEGKIRETLKQNQEKDRITNSQKSEVDKSLRQVRSEARVRQRELLRIGKRLALATKEEQHLEEQRRASRKLEQEIERLQKDQQELRQIEVKIRKFESALSRITNVKPKLVEIQQSDYLIKELSNQLRELMPRARKVDLLERHLVRALDAQRKLPKVAEVLKKTENEHIAIRSELSRIQGQLDVTKKALDTLKTARKVGKEAFCPICKTPLTDKKVADAKRHLIKEVNSLKPKIKQLILRKQELHKQVTAFEREHQSLLKVAARSDLLKVQLADTQQARKQVGELRKRIEEERGRLVQMREDVKIVLGRILVPEEAEQEGDHLRQQLEAVKLKTEEFRAVPGKLVSAKQQRQQIGRKIRSLELKVRKAEPLKAREKELTGVITRLEEREGQVTKQAEGLERQLGELESERRILRQQLEDIRRDKQHLKELQKSLEQQRFLSTVYEYLYSVVFHEKGLPLVLIRGLLEHVEARAKDYLQRLLPMFDLSITIDDEGRVNIEIFDGGQFRRLETYSGGEKTLIGFVIRLAIARAMAFRVGAQPPKCLIIDEGFGPLSAEFRQEVFKALAELVKEYEQIVVISHMEEIREHPAFTNHVRVFKDEHQVSHLELHTLPQNY